MHKHYNPIDFVVSGFYELLKISVFQIGGNTIVFGMQIACVGDERIVLLLGMSYYTMSEHGFYGGPGNFCWMAW